MCYYIPFILIILGIPYLSSKLNFISNKEMYLIIFIAATHIAISLFDAHHGPILNTILDAQSFHNKALMYLNKDLSWFDNFNGANFYSIIISIIYMFTLPEQGISNLSSSFFSMLSILVISRFALLLKINKYKTFILFIFGLSPAYLIYSSITLRESLELLTLLISLLYLFKLFNKYKLYSFEHIFFISSTIIFGLLHEALLIYSILIFCMYIYLIILNIKRIDYMLTGLIFIGLCLISFYFIQDLRHLLKSQSLYTHLLDGNILQYISDYRTKGINYFIGNTNYVIEFDKTTYVSLIKSFFLIYLTYITGPFIWQANNLLMLYASCEALLRMTMLAITFYCLMKARTKDNNIILLLFMFLSLSFLWSLGTFNFGTALRHHILTNWMLLLIAAKSINLVKERHGMPRDLLTTP